MKVYVIIELPIHEEPVIIGVRLSLDKAKELRDNAEVKKACRHTHFDIESFETE